MRGVLPWCNHTGWLGVKHQLTYLPCHLVAVSWKLVHSPVLQASFAFWFQWKYFVPALCRVSFLGPKKDGLCVDTSVERFIHPHVSMQLSEWERTVQQHAVMYMQEIALLAKSHPTQGEPLNFSKGMETSFHFPDHFSRGMETSSQQHVAVTFWH